MKNKIVFKEYLYIATVFFVSLIFFSWGTWDYPLIDLDEPRYPEAAKEMIHSSQYWIPLTNGKFLFEKPILIYWSIILSFKTFGINEFAARLPSVIAGALTISSTYLFGRFFKIGIYASLILATSIEYFIIARLSIPEMLLNFFTISALALYFLISKNLVHKNYFYLMSILMGFGFMAKGPLAIFVPALVIGTYSLLQHIIKDQSLQDKIKLLRSNLKLVFFSSILFLIIGGTWYLIAHFITDGGFTKQFFLTENLARYSSTLTGHKFNWWFYLAVMAVGFLPWSMFIPAFLMRFKTSVWSNPETVHLKLYSLTWIVANIIFFSSSGTKLYNYIFSIFFPLAILTALWLFEERENKAKDILITSIFVLIIGLVFWSLSLNGFFAQIIEGEDFFKNFTDQNLIYAYVALIILLALVGLFFASKKMIKTYFIVISIISVIAYLFSISALIKPFADFKVSGIKNFASWIPANTEVYRFKIDRPSLSFYLNGFTKAIGKKKLIQKISKKKEFCLLAKKDKEEFLKRFPELKIIGIDHLYVYACTKQVEIN